MMTASDIQLMVSSGEGYNAEFCKRSHSRNPLIFGLFARMHLVEQVGSGIMRIRELIETAGLPQPMFQKEGMFTVIFPRMEKGSRKSSSKSAQKSAQKILQLIDTNNAITIKEVAESLGISIITVKRGLKKLHEEGKIKRVGTNRSGKWIILNE